jgi:CRP-like cAMP-binding protein
LIDELKLLNKVLQTDKFLNPEEVTAFSQIWSLSANKRREIITAEGETEKYLYFVLEGVQRVYSLSSEKEATLIFSYPNSFGGIADSFLLQQPSKYNYESITPSRFLRTTYIQFEELNLKYLSIHNFFNQHVYQAFSGLLDRLVELQSFSSEEKFKALMKRSPHLLQSIPHKYITNYLGIDPTNFSKFLNTVRI